MARCTHTSFRENLSMNSSVTTTEGWDVPCTSVKIRPKLAFERFRLYMVQVGGTGTSHYVGVIDTWERAHKSGIKLVLN